MEAPSKNIVNIAAYKFVAISPQAWLELLKQRCEELALKGTIILAPEGINLFLAGTRENIGSFLSFLRTDSIFQGRFSDLEVKESYSNSKPFGKMVVREAKEIITMRHPMIRPEAGRAPAVDAKTLKAWLDQGHDDQGREILMLDTRNAFEVEVGTFEGAVEFAIEKFSQFPDAIKKALSEQVQNEAPWREKTIVSFCTGGIRCEKAALFLQEIDMKNVYQLEGGILKYFEEVGGAHWQGECFVFDERVALDPQLKQTVHSYPGRPLAAAQADKR